MLMSHFITLTALDTILGSVPEEIYFTCTGTSKKKNNMVKKLNFHTFFIHYM